MLFTARTARNDDRLTLIAVSALACMLQDVLHEGLGHGVTAWFSGTHRITMSTVALQSDIETRWVSANGTLVNILLGVILWLLLRRPQRYGPVTRYFLVIAMAGNLFTGTGYFLFSGVTNFGDWAAVIRDLHPHWLWQVGLVVLGVASYYASMLVVASELRPFQGTQPPWPALRGLCWTPYVTDATLMTLAALLSPFGIFYVFASALPATLGANAGLLSLPSLMYKPPSDHPEQVGPIGRSKVWIAIAVIASLFFVIVLGRGVTFTR